MTCNRTKSPVPLSMWQTEAKTFAITVADDDGDPVDLSALTLRFVAHDSANPPVGKFEVESPTITVSGDDSNVANVPVSASQSVTSDPNWHWELWDVTASAVLANGSLTIRPAVKDVA